MRLAALALAGLLCATSAHAQLVCAGRAPAQARQTVGGGFYSIAGLVLTGDCANLPSGFTLKACLSPKDNSYASEGGVAVATASAAGASIGANCSTTSTLSCSGTGSITIPANNATSSFFLVWRTPAQSSGTAIYDVALNGASGDIYGNATSSGHNVGIGNGSGTAFAAAAGRVAVCFSSSTSGYASYSGGTAVALTGSAVASNSTLIIANRASGAAPNAAGLPSLYTATATCNAANVQAASAN